MRAQSIVTVSGKANPWLGGFPDGTTASICDGVLDSAPAQSPARVLGISIFPGQQLAFVASGKVSHDSSDLIALNPPEGNGSVIVRHRSGTEHGIGDIAAPLDALIGVFLGPDSPDATAAPASLNFSTTASRDFLKLNPALKQPFFIGDGLTSSQIQQMIVAPKGATRLFLGVMDECGWWSNRGSFSVGVSQFAPVVSIAYNQVSQVKVCWPSLQNITYQVQFRQDLTTNQWQNLGEPITGDGAQHCVYDEVEAGQPQRIYQIVAP